MKPFLFEIAEQTVNASHSLEGITFVFPNRRAILYFRKYLSQLLSKPAFSPRLLTIEDFVTGMSPLKVPDKLELIHRLYKTYYSVIDPGASPAEPFDQFYFWGDMLLRDFDETDRYLVNAEYLFRDLSHQKELDSSFDFLTEQQRNFLRDFWGSFDEEVSPNKKKFLKVWKQLPEVYNRYRQHLRDHGLAYEGMIYRDVAEGLKNGSLKAEGEGFVNFVGFNALTATEELIITEWISTEKATAHWDIDAYYFNNTVQEAGFFFRKYQHHTVLGKTFSPDIPSNFTRKETGADKVRSIKVFSAAQSVGQVKLMSQVLKECLERGFNPEETLVVLPDEKLLMPVLHGVAGSVDKLNVTMGFPLSRTPLFNLIELLIELQLNVRDKHFNHRQTLAILNHPYVVAADAGIAHTKSKEILLHNWVHIPDNFLATGHDVHRLIFQEASATSPEWIISYLRKITDALGVLPSIAGVDKEYVFHFLKLFNRLEHVIYSEGANQTTTLTGKEAKNARKTALKSFIRLFRQMVRSQNIPFTGEPLRGLQVMGVLETRNLDFRNVFVLSLNEGVFPASANKGSYIPFNIRRAYSLPTAQHQDAIYSYLFYRMLQRAENIFLFYNSETDVLGQGEMSRYLHQLILEGTDAGLTIEKSTLHNPMQPRMPAPLVVKKDELVFNQLARYCEGSAENKSLSPSSLNDYIDCPFKFYLRHVARIREAREVEEDLDARILGNFLHKVMELFYVELIKQNGRNAIEVHDFNAHEKRVEKLIDEIFKAEYRLNPDKPVEYAGQRLIVREVVKRFADEILKKDKSYTPFTMLALEDRKLTHRIALEADGKPVPILGGSIDRADQKEKLVRVVDYKTGKDKLEFENIESLFMHDQKRNKAAFQTMMYALVFYKNNRQIFDDDPSVRLLPGLFNRVNLFDENFRFGLKIGKDLVDNAIPYFPEFEARLKLLLEEMFNPEIPFVQTTNLEACKICPYHMICYR